jgi:pepF/M3 family oligoendopeptidase
MKQASTKAQALPHWDLGSIYPGLESQELEVALADHQQKIDALDLYIDQHAIGRTGAVPAHEQVVVDQLDVLIDRMNAIAKLEATLEAFIVGHVTTDSFNTMAARRMSELEMASVRFSQQEVRIRGWLGLLAEAGVDLDSLISSHKNLSEHAFFLRELVAESRYLMSDQEEALASELTLPGALAWERLQGTITSQIVVPFEQDGTVQNLPMAALQNIRRYDLDEGTRRRAFELEITAWESTREPLAACMNGIKGTVNILSRRRGREDSLQRSLVQARLDRGTFETMLGVMEDSFPMFRRYFKAKAKILGKESLAWWDVFVPVGKVNRTFTYPEARSYILSVFEKFNPGLADFSKKAFDSGWIDAEPRKGKRGGAFCMEVPALEESRILCNFDGSLDQLFTIAHELGHAFHNECQTGLTMIQRSTPMTLAETASIFNETLVTEAALADAGSEDEELSILETFLLSASQVIVDIYSRYLFEKEVFERRVQADLSPDDFCEMMTRAQRLTYGDGLDPAHQHAYMWAWKPHYYSHELSYYNYPYAFGQLFGLGLYSIYGERGSRFFDDYRQFLRDTGQGSAAQLAERFGIKLGQPLFWQKSMQVIEARVDRYSALAAA